jgi:hypothetical protein
MEFMAKYSNDFKITGGGMMKTFLGTKVVQSRRVLKLHLDYYIQQLLKDYKEYIKTMQRPKKVPISPGVVLKPEDVPKVLEQRKQK